MAPAGIGVRHAQQGDRHAAQGRGRVERLADLRSRESPFRPGSEVSRALGDDGEVGLPHDPRRKQRRVDVDGLQLASERLAARNGSHDVARFPHGGRCAREPGRQGRAVVHDVGDARLRPTRADGGDRRGDGRMKIGDEDRHAIDRVGLSKGLVPLGLLLVGPQGHVLERGVAGLDDVPGPGRRIRRQVVRQGRHHEIAPCSQAPDRRGGGEQGPLARLRTAHQLRVGEGPRLFAVVEEHPAFDASVPCLSE